jgi:membrane protein implicated in regulation of membrane protease activity
MEAYWIWWLVALVLVIAEMSSGTFYLIAVAFGLAVAGIVAYRCELERAGAVAAALFGERCRYLSLE